MARKAKTKIEAASSLGPSLDFLAPLLQTVGDPNQTHVILHGRQAVAWNGVIAAGHPIEEDLSAVVPGLALRTAVAQAGSGLVLAVDPPLLTISAGAGGRLRVRLGMLPLDTVNHALPDPNVMSLDNAFLAGLDLIGGLATDGHQRVIAASVGVRGQSMTATDTKMFLEYWHGFNLPEMNLPKRTVAFLLKIKQKLAGFGYSGKTATFHFENNIWVRTQLYTEGWENIEVNNLFQGWDHTGEPIDSSLWEAFDAVKLFLPDGQASLYFIEKGLSSTPNGETGAFASCDKAPQGLAAPAGHLAYMRATAPSVAHWHAGADRDRIAFRNDRLRGLIMHMRRN